MLQFGHMTPEMQAMARAARKEKSDYFKSQQHKLVSSFKDEPHWRRLASHYGIRMPAEFLPCSELKYVRRAVRKLDLDYREIFDEGVALFPRLNPDWPAFAHIGLVLEAAAERDSIEAVEEAPAPAAPNPKNKPTFADVEDLI